MMRPLRKYLRWLRWPLRLVLLWFCLHTAWTLWDGFSDEVPEKAVVVVLGNKVNEDGSVSPRLEARLQKALDLYQTGNVSRIMVSGGLGQEGHPEGSVMKAWLKDRGIPEGDLVADDDGNTTWQTAVNAWRQFPDPEQEIVVVSQYYHISRCKLAMRKIGYSNVKGAHADFSWEWRDLRSVAREFPGYYSYLIRSAQ